MPYHILLVDDDAIFREEFRECLAQDYRVSEASNGAETLEILNKPNDVDLIILDVVLPGTKGTDVLKTIKRTNPDIPIIISTGYSSKDIAIEALKGRADDYIEKPLDLERTLVMIEKYLKAKDGFDRNGKGEGTQDKIERVKSYLERNYDKKVLLKDAADLVCLSPKYLSRVFEERVGTGFSDYKLSVKVRKAKELLLNSGANIDQISSRLGYENTESFIKVFRKFTNLTPATYRKKKQKKTKRKTGKK